ncbi:YfhO family protein [Sphingobacterium mizutaii]|uniref:YfhO family protein n=1 Tax=Sphingobacterium mizutaii TaxID=1010 RepID=UPI00289C9FE7|nr:YfhO family protein [Sphingobacterium mizutaii]
MNNIKFVNSNQAEMDALGTFDPKKEAIVNEGLKGQLGDKSIGQPNNAEIKLTSYHPDTLKYEYSAGNNVFAVFSEIYYDKGWKAYVDGEEVPIIRTDYLLRGLSLPGGNHKVEFVFAPDSMRISNIISLIASITLVLGLGFAIWLSIKHRKEKAK